MKCQNPFSWKNKKNISICHLLKILPRVLNVKMQFFLTVPGLILDKKNPQTTILNFLRK